MKRTFALLAFVAICATTILPTSGQSNDRGRGPEFVPGEMLVQFKAGVDDSEMGRVLGRVNGFAAETVRGALQNGAGRGELVLARYPNMMSMEAARNAVEG